MRRKVRVGDRYRDCTAVWAQWEVARIYQDLQGVPHAVVTNVSDSLERRTIACPTLQDSRRFKLAPNGDGAAPIAVLAQSNASRRACGGGVSMTHH